jgi:hypothetical protein
MENTIPAGVFAGAIMTITTATGGAATVASATDAAGADTMATTTTITSTECQCTLRNKCNTVPVLCTRTLIYYPIRMPYVSHGTADRQSSSGQQCCEFRDE